MTRRLPPRRVLGAVVLVVGLAAACSDGAGSPGTPTSSPAASTSDAPSTPTPTLTGFAGGPVLAVKIDNTTPARPRIGVGEADVVYLEPVEAGLTRLLAIFSSAQPERVGPIRSARESDVQLLANYGPVAFAFSGASAYTLDIVRGGA